MGAKIDKTQGNKFQGDVYLPWYDKSSNLKDKTKKVFLRGNASINTNTQNKHKRKQEELGKRENKGSFLLRLSLFCLGSHVNFVCACACICTLV